MKTKTLEILGVPITTDSRENILEKVIKYLDEIGAENASGTEKTVSPLVMLTPNPEIVMLSGRDKTLLSVLRSADINIPDGWGIVWALKWLHTIRVSRIPGVEMMEDLVKLSAKRGYSVTLIGGGPGVALATLECLKQAYPSLSGSVVEAIYAKVVEEKLVLTNEGQKPLETIGQIETILKEIVKTKAKIVFVALGCPKQEYLISALRDRLSAVRSPKPMVLMAVGGSFDTISGRVSRAPQFMRNMGVEWLYRLVIEPWRIGRMLRGGRFFAQVFLMNGKLSRF